MKIIDFERIFPEKQKTIKGNPLVNERNQPQVAGTNFKQSHKKPLQILKWTVYRNMSEQIIQLQDFLRHWFEGIKGHIELRKVADEKSNSYFYDSIFQLPIETVLNKNCNVYFGVCTRKRENGTKEDVYEVPGLWQDLDGVDFLTNESKEIAKELLNKGEGKGKWKNDPPELASKDFEELMNLIEQGKALAIFSLSKLALSIKPTCIVDSGKGYHLYWKLRQPIKINESNEINFIETLNRRLANYLGGDHTVDVSRCYRLPYTKNVKLRGWELETKIGDFEPERRYKLSDFDWLPEVSAFLNESNIQEFL